MRSRIARQTLAFGVIALVTSAAACSLLRSLDDLGNGVRDDGEGGGPTDGSIASDGETRDDGASDAAIDARPTCAPGTDFTSDPKNCGVCGNACLDGDGCEVGACAFAITQAESNEVAVGGGWVAYNDGQAIWARKTTGGDRHFLANPMLDVGRIATDGTYVFWTTDADLTTSTVQRCALPDCAGGPKVIATAQNHARGITLGGDGRVYWAIGGGSYRCGFGRPLGGVSSARLDGTDLRAMITTPDVSKNSITDVTSVFVHKGTMFWTSDVCGYDGGSQPGEIWKQPTSGTGSLEAVLTNVSSCHFLDLVGDDTDLAFTCEYTHVASTSQAPQSGLRNWRVESDGLQFPRVATDGTSVFWTDNDGAIDGGASPDASSPGSRNVYAENKNASPSITKPTRLWSKPKSNRGLRGIAADGAHLYFSDSDDRRIRAIATTAN